MNKTNTHTVANVAEITTKVLVLSTILVVAMAAANAYLSLKVGMTISASIPAAIISMGVLRFFKHHSVLENNMVQTAASSGEALAAMLAFTLPALLVLKVWFGFHYWTTMQIGLYGGLLGVLFSAVLRKVLLADKQLHFPEGTAVGNVLKASGSKTTDLGGLVSGGLLGATISFLESGFEIISSGASFWTTKGAVLFGAGVGFSPALIGAGYIIGINAGISIFIGVLIGWIFGVPLLTWHYGLPIAANYHSMAQVIWSEHTRFIGLGTIIVCGLWAVVLLIKPIIQGLKSSLSSLKSVMNGEANQIPQTDRDLRINWVLLGLGAVLVAMYLFMYALSQGHLGHLSSTQLPYFTAINVLYVLVLGFFVTAISGFFAGLVGSSTSPLSSLAIVSLILISLIIVFFLKHNVDLQHGNGDAKTAASIAIIITAIIASAAASGNDTIQDLKAGQMVGATPWKQQVMMIVGVFISALIIPAILQLLFQAYGIAGVFPRAGMDPSQMLTAPQASLMATIVQAIFHHNLDWSMITVGGGIAVIALIADVFLKQRNIRLPMVAIGFGIYLPLQATTPIILGTILSYILHRKVHNKQEQQQNQVKQTALITACGLVAGASLMGVVLAIPFAISGDTHILKIMPDSLAYLSPWLGFITVSSLCYWFYQKALSQQNKEA